MFEVWFQYGPGSVGLVWKIGTGWILIHPRGGLGWTGGWAVKSHYMKKHTSKTTSARENGTHSWEGGGLKSWLACSPPPKGKLCKLCSVLVPALTK